MTNNPATQSNQQHEPLKEYEALCRELNQLWRQYDVVQANIDKIERQYYDYYLVLRDLDLNQAWQAYQDDKTYDKAKDNTQLTVLGQFIRHIKPRRFQWTSVHLPNNALALLDDLDANQKRISEIRQQLNNLASSLTKDPQLPDFKQHVKDTLHATYRLQQYLSTDKTAKQLHRLHKQAQAINNQVGSLDSSKQNNHLDVKAQEHELFKHERPGASLFYTPKHQHTQSSFNNEQRAGQLIIDNLKEQGHAIINEYDRLVNKAENVLDFLEQKGSELDRLMQSGHDLSDKTEADRQLILEAVNQIREFNALSKNQFHYQVLFKNLGREISDYKDNLFAESEQFQSHKQQLEDLYNQLERKNKNWKYLTASKILETERAKQNHSDQRVKRLNNLELYIRAFQKNLPTDYQVLADIDHHIPQPSSQKQLEFGHGKELPPKLSVKPYRDRSRCVTFLEGRKSDRSQRSLSQNDRSINDPTIIALTNGWPEYLHEQFDHYQQQYAYNYRYRKRGAIHENPLRQSQVTQLQTEASDEAAGLWQRIKNFFNRNKQPSSPSFSQTNPMQEWGASQSHKNEADGQVSNTRQSVWQSIWQPIKAWFKKIWSFSNKAGDSSSAITHKMGGADQHQQQTADRQHSNPLQTALESYDTSPEQDLASSKHLESSNAKTVQADDEPLADLSNNPGPDQTSDASDVQPGTEKNDETPHYRARAGTAPGKHNY